MQLAGKKILVMGLGATGVATAIFLVKRGAVVTATDSAPEAELRPEALALREKGVRLELGGNRPQSFENTDLVVISPGVPHGAAPLDRSRELGIPVLGEVELAARFIEQPIVAITGTNGKTTTTTLVGEMLRRSGIDVFVGGNIGMPLISFVDSGQKAGVVVAEISSFQLDTIDRFRPKVAVLLNIAEDHLDRYPDVDAYVRSKGRIFENQGSADFAVLNGADSRVAELSKNVFSRKLFFARAGFTGQQPEAEGAVVTDEAIVFHTRLLKSERHPGAIEAAVPCSAIKLFGRHNIENAAAAALAALAAGGRMAAVKDTLQHFGGLPHRLEFVAAIAGVRYYDDSKATNIDAVLRAIECFSAPIVLLLGGRNKRGDFRLLKESLRRRVKQVVLFGEAGDEIAAALDGAATAIRAGSMAEAVASASRIASTGDVVLLSPGCASFDMYENYARRGEDFRRNVEKLEGAE
ncbi:MAG: UDP-N-acetylmuramoyl-L-alanine--D-glutamate ligase [Desulfobacterales bacterium]|jgi:UDP-N-acetylmuramoylalanine--D-glutamate ligase